MIIRTGSGILSNQMTVPDFTQNINEILDKDLGRAYTLQRLLAGDMEKCSWEYKYV